MTRAYMIRSFHRWARKSGLADRELWKAILEMDRGLIDAELGGDLVKKRVPLPGRGKRGGARVVVATRRQGIWYFLLGYSKNDADSFVPGSLQVMQEVGAQLLDLNPADLAEAINNGSISEVRHEDPQR